MTESILEKINKLIDDSLDRDDNGWEYVSKHPELLKDEVEVIIQQAIKEVNSVDYVMIGTCGLLDRVREIIGGKHLESTSK